MRSRARTGWYCPGLGRRGTSEGPLQFLEPVRRTPQRLHLLGKRKADLLPAALRIQVETASGYRGEPDLADHPVGKAHVVFTKGADVGHHVVGAVGRVGLETGAVQDFEREIAPLAVGAE